MVWQLAILGREEALEEEAIERDDGSDTSELSVQRELKLNFSL
jgi:hypothetical protein